MNNALQGQRPVSEFQEQIIHVARVARVVKGGRRFRFRALVAVGNGNDMVGVGTAKGADVQLAVSKAVDVAKKSLIKVALSSETIPHQVQSKVGGSIVLLKPAAPGTGVIAGGTVRAVLDLCGVNNVLSKSLGSTNKVNIAYATMEALKQLVPKSEWVTTSIQEKKVSSSSKSKIAPTKPSTKEAVKKSGKDK